jgi:cyclopropane-fatty-acyl-phospholipid synthase
MTNSITFLAEPQATPRIPAPLLKSLRRKLFKTIHELQTGQLLVVEPDGTQTHLGNPEIPALRVHITDMSFYAYAAFGGTTGIGQAWILGLWQTQDLVEVTRLFVRERSTLGALEGGMAKLRLPLYKAIEWRRRNTLTGSSRNISAHYDLGNDFFKLFLDDSMTYSAGVFPSAATTLAQAQHAKYDMICRKLNLQAGENVLEIGTGWGGFALHAAREYGVQVTTTTISQEQFELATARIAEAGLSQKIQVVKQDYRTLEGRYEKIASIEMIEAVGHDFLPDYFRKLQDLLTPQGEVVIQAITIQDQFYDEMRKGTDFIREYIFPGGHLPCINEMLRVTSKHTDLRLFHLEDFGQDYARTLQLWRAAFHQHLPQVVALGYNAEFRRMWDFYLASCEAGFLETTTSVVHAHFTMPECQRERHTFQAA